MSSSKNFHQWVSSLSLEEKIGQMFLVGFRGKCIEEAPEALSFVEKEKVGGLLFFDYDIESKSYNRNIFSWEQVQSLCKDLQSRSSIPLFLAIDEEGGQVSRFSQLDTFPKIETHQKMGEKKDQENIKKQSQQIAKALKELGFNLNFAPVVDVNVYPQNPIIGKYQRSFSSQAEEVATCAEAFIEGHREEGVLTCLKHFPGHGSSREDSHHSVTDVTDFWSQEELTPYRSLIKKKYADMVMTAHIVNKQLDEVTATLSSKILTDLLTKEMGYQGVIISDDLDMKAVSQDYSLEQLVHASLQAGVDMFIIGNNLVYETQKLSLCKEIILEAVNKGTFTEEKIHNSVTKILTLKNQIGIL